MADKEVKVSVPEERVPEFYSWFAAFLSAEPGTPPPFGRHGRRGPPGSRHHGPAQAWSADDADQAAWLYGRLAPPARQLLDLLIDAPGERFAGEELAKRLELQKGAHGVAGILAWPGRYSRRLDRTLPITTEGRPDGGTDYYMDPELASLFAAARAEASSPRGGGRSRRGAGARWQN
jgi:hypothetical protein